jgi:hypothetical protein
MYQTELHAFLRPVSRFTQPQISHFRLEPSGIRIQQAPENLASNSILVLHICDFTIVDYFMHEA